MRIEEMHHTFDLYRDRVDSNDRPDFMPWEKDDFLNAAIDQFIMMRYGKNNQFKRGFETHQKRISELANLHIKSPELQPSINPIDLGNGRYEIRLSTLGNNINSQYFRYLFLTKAIIEIEKDNCIKQIELDLFQIDDSKTTYNSPSWTWCRIHGNFGKSTFNTPSILSFVSDDIMSKTLDIQDNSNSINETHNNDKLGSLYLDTTDNMGVQQYNVVRAFISYIKYPNRVFIGGYDHIDKHSTSSTEPIHCDLDESFHDEIVRIAVNLSQSSVQDMQGYQISTKQVSDDNNF